MSVTTYYRCEYCLKECEQVEVDCEEPVYEPETGIGWRSCVGLESHCCGEATFPCVTLALTERAKESLLRIWNRRGNAEIINHIQNVLPYIGEPNE